MSKPRTLGKPARLAGSGRKLTRVFFHTKPNHVSLEDNPCMKASKDICYGLAVFHATFGFEDNKQVSELEIHSRLAPSNVKRTRGTLSKVKARGLGLLNTKKACFNLTMQ